MNLRAPRSKHFRSATLPAVWAPPAGSSTVVDDLPYPEPEFSRPLLFALLALLTLAQIGYEGIRYGLHVTGPALSVAGHALTFPFLALKQTGAIPKGDALYLLAPYWDSPFWSLLARLDSVLHTRYLLFACILLLARWASVMAVFRLSERAFGQPLAALLAAMLWLCARAVGGVSLHHNYLASSDVSCALLLWSIVLWNENYERWGLVCGLAACVDAPLAFTIFFLLWMTGIWRSAATPPGGSKGSLWHTAKHHLESNLRAALWCVLGTLPIWLNAWPHFAATTITGFFWWLAHLQSARAQLSPEEISKTLLPLLLLLAGGIWCWKKSLSVSATAKAPAVFAASLMAAVAIPQWLLGKRVGDPLLLILLRAAPLAAALAVIAMSRVMERGAARRGSFGFLLLWLWAAAVVFVNSTLCLIVGVVLIELLNRFARHSSVPGRIQSAGRKTHGNQQLRSRFAIFFKRRDVGRGALILFVLAIGWRARFATGKRLNSGGGILSQPQPAAWLEVQRWARTQSTPNSLFMASAPGFRLYSRRAVFLDPDDKKWRYTTVAFAREWQKRYPLAAPFWGEDLDARPISDWMIYRLHSRGVTHLVLPVAVQLPQNNKLFVPVFKNAEWIVYWLK